MSANNSLPSLLDVSAAEALVATFRKPTPTVIAMFIDHLDDHLRRFIGMSPFCCMSTANAAGHQDISPRGDLPGSFKVLNERTIAIPDRPGNNRADAIRNLVSNPQIGFIFIIPGIEETVRVSGTAQLSVDPALLKSMEVQGRSPRLAIVASVRVAHLHCGKAFRRSKLWQLESQVPRAQIPTLGKIIGDQIALTDDQISRLDELNDRASREALWEPFRP